MNTSTTPSTSATVKPEALAHNAVIFANVIELVTGVVTSMGGQDTAAAMNRDGLSRAVLSNTVANHIKTAYLA